MPGKPIEFDYGGSRYALVRSTDVRQRLSEAAAWRLVTRGLESNDPRFARQLEDVAGRLSGGGCIGRTRDAAAAIVDALVSGRLVEVAWGEPVRLMSEPRYVDLRDIGRGHADGPIAGGDPTEPAPRRDQPEDEDTFIDVVFATEGGRPLAGVQFALRLTTNETIHAESGPEGRFFVEHLAVSGDCSLELAELIELPPVSQESTDAQMPEGIRIQRNRSEPLLLRTGTPHRIVVMRPRLRVLELADGYFGTDRAVLLFALEGKPGPGEFEERVTARGIFRTLFEAAGEDRLLVAGHADTVGGDDDNQTLSEHRAKSVHLYLAGDRDGWADHTQTIRKHDDIRTTLQWVADVEGVDCAPRSDVGGALHRFRLAFVPGTTDDDRGPYDTTADDWRAVYDLYDRELARLLHVDPLDVERFRSKLTFVEHDAIGCGERHPVEAIGENGFESDENRRVDILLFPPHQLPTFEQDPPDDEIYGGTFAAQRINVPGESMVRILVIDDAASPSREAFVTIKTSTGVFSRSVGVDGITEIPCLVGETIEVVNALSNDQNQLLFASQSRTPSDA